MGNLRTFALLGFHWARKTHQYDSGLTYGISETPPNRQSSLQYRAHRDQDVSTSILRSSFSDCGGISRCALDCGLLRCELVHSYQLHGHFQLCSNPQVLGSYHTRPLFEPKLHISWHNHTECHYRLHAAHIAHPYAMEITN